MSQDSFPIPRYEDAPFHSKTAFSWMWFFCKPYKAKLLALLGVSFLRKLFLVMFPLYVAKAIEFIESGEVFERPEVMWWAMGIYAVTAFIVFVSLILISRYFILVDKISRIISLFSLRHLMKLAHNWHETSGSGGKFQQVIVARQNFLLIMHGLIWEFTRFFSSLAAVIISITVMNIPTIFYLLFFLFFVTFAYVSLATVPRMYRYLDHSREMFERISSTVYEFVNSVTTVKSFNLSQHIVGMGKEAEGEGFERETKYLKYKFLRWVLTHSIALIWIMTILSFSYKALLDKDISVAAFTLMAFLTFQVWDQLERLTMYYTQYIEQSNGVMRLVNTLRSKSEIVDRDGAKALKVKTASISIQDLKFQYNPDVAVFGGLSLNIKGGEKIGLVGKSGAGKSTLANILLRFYDIERDQGSVEIDGQDIRDVTLHSLRDAVSIIPQDTAMFNHSIGDNIRYGRLEASDGEVIVAAKQAYAHEFIEKLPEGYDTLVGERGLKLSGGQRQRIAIARAILKEAPILILDEATSALDSESETLIQKSFEEIVVEKTVIAIAHRLSTLAKMDRIVVMDQGRIVQQGTHQDLLQKDGIYKDLWETQSGEFIE